MRLNNKNAVIIGGNRGIGRAIATGFAKEGCNVAITYAHHPAESEEVVNEIKACQRNSAAFKLDLTTSSEIEEVVQELENFFTEIDVLVINAGVLTRCPYVDIPEEDLDLVLSVNFRGPFILTQAIAKHMMNHHTKGSIIFISSVSSQLASRNIAHYECSKAALSMLGKSAALEFAKDNIRVNVIEPGLTETDMNKDQWSKNTDVWQKRVEQIPLERAGKPSDHVGAAIYLASDESSWVTGSSIIVDGGQHIKA